jgi:hypothetical protein
MATTFVHVFVGEGRILGQPAVLGLGQMVAHRHFAEDVDRIDDVFEQSHQ